MLGFLRTYQKYFWLMITIVIVISFSFFGTYSTMQERTIVDPVAFKTIDGSIVYQSEVEEMVKFLATDSEDKEWIGGAWGPNFLNDGVLKNDFIQTGLAQILATSYQAQMKDDLNARLEKEKKYRPYENAQAKFISVPNAWKYFSPEMNKNLEQLQILQDAAAEEAFQVRLDLFQGQRRFPPYALRQALRYQEQQFKWVTPDTALQRLDLSLFGYHTVEDWFGPKFVRLAAAFIMNSSIVARERGYYVSKEEAYADLVKNAELSYQTMKNNPNLGVATSLEYFREQLRIMHMDLGRAISIWQKVLEFRRLFQEQANSVFLDPQGIGQVNQYAQEAVEGELYGLPPALKINDFKTMQQFELYLSAVSKKGADSLDLPQTFLTPDEVAKKFPELVQKRYFVTIASIDRKALQGKVSVKETWDWEVEDAHWERLKKEFPDIGITKASTKEERFHVLENLDAKTRARIDTFARESIVEAHPEWIEEALAVAPANKREVSIRLKGSKGDIPQVKDPKELIALLDLSDKKLEVYTPNKNNFYKIIVLEKGPGLELLTFEEAKNDRTLEDLLGAQPKKDYGKLLEAIRSAYVAANPGEKNTEKMVEDYAATLRLYSMVQEAKNKIAKNPNEETKYILQGSLEEKEGLKTLKPLADQWKLVKNNYIVQRGVENSYFDVKEAKNLPENGFSKIYSRRNGEIVFFKKLREAKSLHTEDLYQNVYQVQRMLGMEAEGELMKNLLGEFEKKNAMSMQ